MFSGDAQRENASDADNLQLMGSKKNNREPYQLHDVMFTAFLINYEN